MREQAPALQRNAIPMSKIRAAAVQMDVYIGENARNLQRVLERLEETAKNGAKLVVFPECALTGYCFSSLEDALPSSDAAWSADIWPFAARCEELKVVGILGFLQSASSSPSEETGQIECSNSALLAGAGGPGSCFYAKTHLPTLGAD